MNIKKSIYPSKVILIILLLILVGLVKADAAYLAETLEYGLIDADLTYVGEDSGDWAGYFSSPAGDVNGDGLGDLFVGAPMAGDKVCPIPELPDGTCPPPFIPKGQGVAYLVLGTDEVLPSDPINLEDADASFLGCEVNSMTARQLYTAGDVNGDGFDDMFISGWKCGESYTGKAYLILGKEEADWGRWYPIEDADASFLGENEWDFLSYYLSTAGDVNGDNLDDMLISSTHFDITGTQVITNPGKIYLILGRESADWGTDFPVENADASFLGEAEEDRIGRAVTGVGDVNNDGFDDFLVGSISSDDGGWDAGQNYLFLGRATESDPGYDPSRPWWGNDFSVTGADASFVGEAEGDEAGRRVAGAGDVNGDGYDDFLIGAARHSTAGDWAGIAYLMLGREAADWGTHFNLINADASFIGEAEKDQAGRRLSGAGDVNNDGFDDFIVGAPHNARGGEFAGSAYLIYGREIVDWGNYYPLANSDVIHVGVPDVGVAGYDMGWLGDFNGDGTDDYLIAAYGGRNNNVVPGDTYVLFGGDDLAAKAKTPMPVRFSPNVTDGDAFRYYLFTGEYWDPNGWQDIDFVQLILGEDENDNHGLQIWYEPSTDDLYLGDTDGVNRIGPCKPGEIIKLDNGIIRVDCSQCSVTSDGNRLEITLRARWIVSPEEPQEYRSFMRAVDQSGNDSQFREFVAWNLFGYRYSLPFLGK